MLRHTHVLASLHRVENFGNVWHHATDRKHWSLVTFTGKVTAPFHVQVHGKDAPPSSEPGSWKVRMLAALSFPSDAQEQAGDRPVVLFAMTGLVAQGTREHQAWRQELKRQKVARVLALNEAWAGLRSDSDLWLSAFQQGATSPVLASAIDALQRALPPLADAGLRGDEVLVFVTLLITRTV